MMGMAALKWPLGHIVTYPPGDVVPRDIDLEIARLKLASMDVQIDQLTPAQEEYLSSWTHGT